MKKVMILATVAMMGMGFAGNVEAAKLPKPIETMVKAVAKVAGDPMMSGIILGYIEGPIVNTAAKKLKLSAGDTEKLSEYFTKIIDILKSKAGKYAAKH